MATVTGTFFWLPWLLLWVNCVMVAMANVMGKLCCGCYGYRYGDIFLAAMATVMGNLCCGCHGYCYLT
jgi:hypothetical protein